MEYSFFFKKKALNIFQSFSNWLKAVGDDMEFNIRNHILPFNWIFLSKPLISFSSVFIIFCCRLDKSNFTKKMLLNIMFSILINFKSKRKNIEEKFWELFLISSGERRCQVVRDFHEAFFSGFDEVYRKAS